MKKQILKFNLLLLLLFPLALIASTPKERVEKRINREFRLETNGRVEIDNKYGNIDIGIGPSGKVTMDIIVAVTAGSIKKAQENLERIHVDFEEGINRISATTEIESANNWTFWLSSNKVEMDIRYQVTVPADVYLDLVNKFGKIYVETSDRDIEIDLSYGSIRLGDINGRLKLDMSYSDGSISQIKDGNVVLAFSDLEMEDGNDIILDMKYTDLTTGTFKSLRLISAFSNMKSIAVHNLQYNGKYDDLNIEFAEKVNAECGYSGIGIDELTREASFDMRFGDLKVSSIHPGFSKLNINTSYTGVKLTFKPGASFSVDAETNYGDIKHTGLKITENISKQTTRILKGSRGSGSGLVYARMNYGELVIE